MTSPKTLNVHDLIWKTRKIKASKLVKKIINHLLSTKNVKSKDDFKASRILKKYSHCNKNEN